MSSKIDWLNHTVAFFSALLGILIAFQLEDYADNRKDNEELKSALNAIKNEINNNLNIYQTNVDQLGDWLEYWEVIKGIDENGVFAVAKNKYQKLNAKAPQRYEESFVCYEMVPIHIIKFSVSIGIKNYNLAFIKTNSK